MLLAESNTGWAIGYTIGIIVVLVVVALVVPILLLYNVATHLKQVLADSRTFPGEPVICPAAGSLSPA